VGTEEALSWLREVEGRLYCSGPDASGRSAWVAVVRTPGAPGARGKLIIALGDTLEEAAGTALAQWQRLWRALGPVH
jgi:hypothetical protein